MKPATIAVLRFGGAGLALAVLVAWILAAARFAVPGFRSFTHSTATESWLYAEWSGAGITRALAIHFPPGQGPNFLGPTFTYPEPTPGEVPSPLVEFLASPAPSATIVTAVSAGWPIPCLAGTTRQNCVGPRFPLGLRPSPTSRSAIVVGDGPPGMEQYRLLPLRPLWLPLLADAALYGGISFVAVRAVLGVRAASRRRRGLCVACGHPVSDHARCPECGLAAAPSAPA